MCVLICVQLMYVQVGVCVYTCMWRTENSLAVLFLKTSLYFLDGLFLTLLCVPVGVCDMYVWVLSESPGGHWIPRNWSYRRL